MIIDENYLEDETVETPEQTDADSAENRAGFDQNLRPKRLNEFIGQTAIKANLELSIQAARQREEPIDHIILAGPAGLGKTTLASIVAAEMEAPIRITSGPAMERAGDLASILTNLQAGEILFIDEIHRINRTIEEILYPAMEDFALDLVLGKGPGARTMRLDLPRFTLIGATTKPGSLSAPLRDRFGLHYQLDNYTNDDLTAIVLRSAGILDVDIDDESAGLIATRARRTPRVANRLIKRVRDYALVHNDNHVTPEVAQRTFRDLGIDELGLDATDRRILTVISQQFNGGPVGVDALAAATAIERVTLEDVYEPFLLQIGVLDRTTRGRIITDRGIKHITH